MGRRPGFTLIELLVVVIIIGIISMIATVKVHAVRQRAAQATLEADLRQLSIQQENYVAIHGVYASDPRLAPSEPSAFTTLTITHANHNGWAGYAVHSGWPGRRCALFYGTAPPEAPATMAGVITCDPL